MYAPLPRIGNNHAHSAAMEVLTNDVADAQEALSEFRFADAQRLLSRIADKLSQLDLDIADKEDDAALDLPSNYDDSPVLDDLEEEFEETRETTPKKKSKKKSKKR